nr:MotA/TolQ/ExbB proton channel family protein [Lachnospiraceae bacterium]
IKCKNEHIFRVKLNCVTEHFSRKGGFLEMIIGALANIITVVIVVAGVILLGLFFRNYISLKNHYTEIKSVMSWKNTRTYLNKNTKEIEDQSVDEKVTPDTIRELQTEFYKTCSWHEAYAQLIPVFPLLGILGTVSGLMAQLGSQGVEGMVDSLNGALGSTFWGLIAAIILKFLDAAFSSRIINDTEIILDDYEKKIDNAVRLGNISE